MNEKPPRSSAPTPRRVLLLGGTGTIGRATSAALVEAGHEVTALVRTSEGAGLPAATTVRRADVADLRSLTEEGFCGERFDVLVSCLASRTGAPKDAWAIDYAAHAQVLETAREAGVGHVVLLSAICVQKPLLEFQKAKLAFEAELMASGLTYSIVRPTAFFKSLSGQIARVCAGKSFMVFGDGTGTACKPISDRDLAAFLVGCISETDRHNKILPIGGPGPAITPREQGTELFRLAGRPPRFQSVPPALFGAAAGVLGGLGRIAPPLAEKAELARIARYYGTESMLLWDEHQQRYDADATPSFGNDTLFDHYARVIGGETEAPELGAHAIFERS